MLRKLTLDQINDWFTIGKTVTDVELLGSPPAFPAEAARDEAQRRDWAPRPLSRKSSEMEYINKYRQLEAQEFDMYGSDQSPSRPGPRPALTKLNNMTCIPETHYKYPDLPINRCKEEVISLIESNSVVIIHGATGSGKSTQLPQYILDHYIQRSAYCNIVVTQPRKIGASSIARWISRERAWTLGGLVGYQVGLEKIATEDTKLIYMTTGVLLQKIVSAKSLMEFTHVFIDEVHERTEEMDFLLLVVRKLLRTNSRFVKVILMSATINCKEFADYFAVPVQNKMNPAYVFEVEGKPHSIEEYYLDDLGHIHHGRLSPHVLEEPVIPKNIYEVAVSLIQIFDNLDMQEIGSKTWSGAQFVLERSSVLVFLPGLGEINYMHELLTNMVHKRLQVYPLHSSVTLEEQNNVFLSPVPGYRKIILSTNIAESSVTVPDVKYGRAGRVSKGYCYRLVHRDFWDSSIPDHVIPEMLRCPLGSTVLKVKLLDMGEPRALLATALSPPSLSDIERTILLLKEVGALAVSGQREDENPHDGELTFLGRVLAQLPVNQQLGKLIVLGHVFGCLDECLIIAAALSLKNFFAMPFRQHLDGYRNKVNFSGNSKSDCIALVEAFKTWQTCRQSGELRHPKDELDWGRLHYIQIKRIREVAELYEELKNRISQFNMYVDSRRPVMDQEYIYKQRFILQVVLAGAFYPNYFTFGQPDEEMALRELAGKDPKTTIVLKHIPPYGFLYYKQLQSLFRQCGQVKSIVFDGAKVNVDFQKQTVDPMQVSFNTLDPSQTITDLLLTVDVTEVVEVGHFWGYRIDDKNSEILKKLTAEINQLKLVPLPVHPHPDLVCLAPFADFDKESYFRAQILYVSGNSAEVFFVDYGNRSHVDLDLLMEIPYQLLELPFQALEFKICKMRPSAKSLVCGEHWSGGASQRFASLVSGCALLVRVFSVVHSVLHVDVYRYAGLQDTVNVRDILIKEGYAELAEEPYESKQSHEALKGLFSKSIQNMADMTVSSPVKDDEKYLIRVLLESFSSNKLGPPNCKYICGGMLVKPLKESLCPRESTIRHFPLHLKDIITKAILHGPFNPYELKCHSLTRISKFRVDRDGKCYTGVLCGLGWNPTTGAPILPEHDIELAFDIQFNVEDIVEINILRAAINKLVCDGPNGSKFLGPERIAQLQDNARQKLLGLFCQLKPRQRVVPKWHEKPYEWNQVDPKLVMEQADRESSRGKNTFLYQLHKLIVLNT